jgi:hypothetical protein
LIFSSGLTPPGYASFARDVRGAHHDFVRVFGRIVFAASERTSGGKLALVIGSPGADVIDIQRDLLPIVGTEPKFCQHIGEARTGDSHDEDRFGPLRSRETEPATRNPRARPSRCQSHQLERRSRCPRQPAVRRRRRRPRLPYLRHTHTLRRQSPSASAGQSLHRIRPAELTRAEKILLRTGCVPELTLAAIPQIERLARLRLQHQRAIELRERRAAIAEVRVRVRAPSQHLGSSPCSSIARS